MVVEVVKGEKGVKTNQMIWQKEGNLFVVMDDDLFLVSCGLYWSKDIIESIQTSFFKGCFCEFVKEGDFIYFDLSSWFCFFLLSSDRLSE